MHCSQCAELSNKERYELWQARQESGAATEQKPAQATTATETKTTVTADARVPNAAPSPAFYLLILAGVIGGVVGYFMLEGRDKQMAKRILVAGASLTGVFLLFAFAQALYFSRVMQSFGDALTTDTGGSSAAATAAPSEGAGSGSSGETGNDSTPAPPFGVNVTDFEPVRTWTFTASQDGGYKQTGTLTVGEALPVSRSAYFADIFGDAALIASSACSMDADRDAVIPYRLKLANTTNGFDAQVAARMTSTAPLETTYADGPTCAEDGLVGWTSAEILSPGDAAAQEGFIVLENYFTPNAPEGDPAVLGAVRMSLAPSDDAAGRSWLTDPPGVSGPGIVVTGEGFNTDFYLSGVVPPQLAGTYSGTVKDGTPWNVYISEFDGGSFTGRNEIYWANSPQGFRTSFTGTFDATTRRIVMSEDPTAKGAGEFVGEVSADGTSMTGTWSRYSDGQSFSWNLTKD